MPNRFISTIGPEVIHEMNVMMCDTNPNLPLEFLRYALTNCPNLQHFSYKSMNSPDYGIYIGTDPEVISQFVREKKDTSNTIQENIKVIKLKDMKPSNEFLDLMRTYMPATEAFICGLDDFEDQANESFEADLTAFKQLNSVQLSARFLCEKGRDTTFLEIQFLDKNWEYYCLIISDAALSVTKTTLKQMNEQLSGENKMFGKAVIKCLKRVKFALTYYDYHSVFTIIDNGEISTLDGELSFSMSHRFLR
ncbi:uncharacterized protein EV154DRAFT_512018 [Mucor mucedo]|uniref:uncharacterized protein n=1 Tax=Mucor mucedo TaxID=29922 RepID=UPI00221FAC9C|nr:uncharacterized protein EV154DRAFT_512018 [Mucor mucedo]KAI7890262.1 hypothetical protein EV154DRAFT_512018 [Mucor mucedo]